MHNYLIYSLPKFISQKKWNNFSLFNLKMNFANKIPDENYNNKKYMNILVAVQHVSCDTT